MPSFYQYSAPCPRCNSEPPSDVAEALLTPVSVRRVRKTSEDPVLSTDPFEQVELDMMVAPFTDWALRLRQHRHLNARHSEPCTAHMTCVSPQRRDSLDSCAYPAPGAHDEEEAMLPRTLDQLTPAHRNAIRAIRRIKLMVARRKFKEALRPYDVKDVIEQYSAGHVDLLARVKNIQHRIDGITGKQPMVGKNPFDVYKYPVVSRVIRLEKRMNSLSRKMDYLIDLHLSERMHSLAHGTSPSGSHGSLPSTQRAGMQRSGSQPESLAYRRVSPTTRLPPPFATHLERSEDRDDEASSGDDAPSHLLPKEGDSGPSEVTEPLLDAPLIHHESGWPPPPQPPPRLDP